MSAAFCANRAFPCRFGRWRRLDLASAATNCSCVRFAANPTRLLSWPGTMASDAPNQEAAPTSSSPSSPPSSSPSSSQSSSPSSPTASEPSGPIGRLKHDHIDLDAEERRHRRDKKGSPPVMAIILGLTILTAIVFYVLHVRAVAKETAEAERRAAAAAAAQPPATPPTTPPTTAPAAATAKPPTTGTADKAAPKADKPAADKPAPKSDKPAPKSDKPKKSDDKTKNLPRLPILPEG